MISCPPPPKPGWEKDVVVEHVPPGIATRFQKGQATTLLVQDPSEITDAFLIYFEEQTSLSEPVDLYTWFAYATRHLGIGRRWWGRVMRGDRDAPKLPNLRQACEQVEDVIAGHLSAEALKNKLHPGLVAAQIKTMEDRDKLAAEKEAAARADEQEVPKHQVANLIHPDCTNEQLAAMERAGVQPMLYTQQQLEAGLPWIMPELPDG